MITYKDWRILPDSFSEIEPREYWAILVTDVERVYSHYLTNTSSQDFPFTYLSIDGKASHLLNSPDENKRFVFHSIHDTENALSLYYGEQVNLGIKETPKEIL